MGFSLLSQGAKPPEWPHVVCVAESADESGFAWHETRQPCFVATVSLPARLVAAAIDGRDVPGIDHLLSIARVREEAPGAFRHLFRSECPACDADHKTRALAAIRLTKKYIHEGAIAALRKAKVPEFRLVHPWFVDRPAPEDPERAARYVERMLNLPVCASRERTLQAQLAYANQYALRKQTPRRHYP